MTRKIEIEAPTGQTLKIYLFPHTTETAGDVAGYSLTEVEDMQYQYTVTSDLLVGTYRCVIEVITASITTAIDSGYVLLLAEDGVYVMSDTLPTTSTVTTTTENTYSSFGPKRVKTKEMEIEQFSPKELQRVEERTNNTTLPSFCGGFACIGRFKNEPPHTD